MPGIRTILISINGSKSIVRTSRDIRIISALDPETVLLPLEMPLISTEEHSLRYGGHKTLKVTAGLHRAVWVAGTAAFVDVNIVNNTNRKVQSIKCKLRRHILAYKNVGSPSLTPRMQLAYWVKGGYDANISRSSYN